MCNRIWDLLDDEMTYIDFIDGEYDLLITPNCNYIKLSKHIGDRFYDHEIHTFSIKDDIELEFANAKVKIANGNVIIKLTDEIADRIIELIYDDKFILHEERKPIGEETKDSTSAESIACQELQTVMPEAEEGKKIELAPIIIAQEKENAVSFSSAVLTESKEALVEEAVPESEMVMIAKLNTGVKIYDKIVDRILESFKDERSMYNGGATSIIAEIIRELFPPKHNAKWRNEVGEGVTRKLSEATIDSYTCQYRRYIIENNLFNTRAESRITLPFSPKSTKVVHNDTNTSDSVSLVATDFGLSEEDIELLDKLPFEDRGLKFAMRRKLRELEQKKIIKCSTIATSDEGKQYLWELDPAFKSYYCNPESKR